MIWNILKNEKLTVKLPHSLNEETIYPFIETIIDKNYDSKCDSLIFDFANLKFIEPSGVTVLSNLIEFLKLSKVKVAFANMDTKQFAIRYLDDSDFFNHYMGKKLRTSSELRPTTLPLELVEYSRSYEYMGFRLIPWLSRNLNVPEAALSTLKVCFQEIFNNIKDHSEVTIGCIFAQHYPNLNQIQITASDFGIGIPTNIRKLEPALSDHLAIDKACDEGYTTQTTGRNRGAGLDVLIKNVVFKNSGNIVIQSRHGRVVCKKEGDYVRRIPREVKGFYPGTLIQLILDTEKFQLDEMEEIFEWQ